jgi:5-methylcytosine-specific restriction endonuclease McrA
MKKRKKRLPDKTPISIIKHALRLLWLRSRERSAAIRRDNYTCQRCHKKQSKAKGREITVEVHHIQNKIDWQGIAEYLQRQLLVHPDRLVTLCPKCHDEEEK